MPFRDPDWEDVQRDHDLFPAYSDYLYGPDTRLQVAQEPGLHPLLYPSQSSEPIRYTDAMPSRSLLYSVQGALREAEPGSIDKMELPSTSTADEGDALDLRWPHPYPDMVTLLPPESVRPMPVPLQHPQHPPSIPLNPVRQVLSAEATRQTLYNASQPRPTPNAPSPPPHQFRKSLAYQAETQRAPEQRRNPRRQATNRVLYRSSSGTDVDSQLGQMSPNRRTLLSPPTSPMPLDAHTALSLQHQPQRLAHYPTRSASGAQPTMHSQAGASNASDVPLIRPGELLSNPRYAVAPRDNLERMNAQFTDLYFKAQKHEDPRARMLARLQIQADSANIHSMMRDWEDRTMKMAVELPVKLGLSTQMEQQSPQGPHVHHQPVQPQVYQQPPPVFQSPQSQYQDLTHQQPQEYVSLPQFQIIPVHRPSTPIRFEIRQYVNKHLPNFVAAMRITGATIDANTTDPKQLETLAQQPAAHAWIVRFKASLGPEAQRYMVDIVTKMDEARSEGRDWMGEMPK
jgi:hypothetical protein